MAAAHQSIPDFIARRSWWVLPLLVWTAVIGVSLASHFEELEAHSQEVAVERHTGGAANYLYADGHVE